MQPFYLIEHEASGTVYRVAADGQSKVPTDVVPFDRLVLRNMRAEHPDVLNLPGFDAWLDSIPG